MSVLPRIDFVLVYDAMDLAHAQTRAAFEKAMRKIGLILQTESVDKDVYVGIYCPFDLLAVEAENVKLEMPLKNCAIYPDDSGCMATLMKNFNTDDEVDFVSGPFERDKLHFFEGHEDRETFFRSGLRSLLVYHILISLPYDEELTAATVHGRQMKSLTKTKRRGLPYLLIKGVYKDSYVLHDQSIDDPIYLKMKEKAPQQYAAVAEKLKSFTDQRRHLNRTWTKFKKFQPLWRIRNYFGEKIAFYFAWVGTYVTTLWIPAVFGLCDFLYGIYTTVDKGTFKGCNCPCDSANSSASNYTVSPFRYSASGTIPLSWEIDSNLTIDSNSGALVNPKDCGPHRNLEMSDFADAALYALNASFDNQFNFPFALLICLWGTVFLETWKRKNHTLAYEWDVNSYEDSEPDRPEFFGTEHMLDPVTKELIWVYPSHLRLKRFVVSAIVVVSMMMLVFLSIAAVITFQVVMSVEWKCKPVDIPESTSNITYQMTCNRCVDQTQRNPSPMVCLLIASILPAILNAISVLLLDYIYSIIAVKLTNWENHQTQSDYNNALILKLFVFQFVNSYAYLVYTAVIRRGYGEVTNNGLWGMGPEYRDGCSEMCNAYLSLQVLALMLAKPTLKAAYDIFYPWLIRQARNAFVWVKLRTRHKNDVIGVSIPPRRPSNGGMDASGAMYLERERRKPPLGDFCLEEFSEKVIQFGYVMMFTISFPLAPFIALIVSLIDIRLDAHRLLWFNRRPIAFIAPDIGLWKSILQFLNFCGIVCNSFLMSTSPSSSKKWTVTQQMMQMLIFEHVVFFGMYLLQIVIPDVPSRVKQAMRRERYQISKLLSEGYLPVSRTVSQLNPNIGGGPVAVGGPSSSRGPTPSPSNHHQHHRGRRPSVTTSIAEHLHHHQYHTIHQRRHVAAALTQSLSGARPPTSLRLNMSRGDGGSGDRALVSASGSLATTEGTRIGGGSGPNMTPGTVVEDELCGTSPRFMSHQTTVMNLAASGSGTSLNRPLVQQEDVFL